MKEIIRKMVTLNFLVEIYNFLLLKYRGVTYGRNLIINGKLYCVSSSKKTIIIGENVKINSSLRANPIGGDTRTILFAKELGKIIIGNNVGISNATIFASQSIVIGNYVMIGGGTKIYDTDFHWLEYEKRMSRSGGISKPVEIKDGAFIGAHAIILKGVTIGEKSIIGAGSVVTKNVPPGEIWAGNPAKYIGKI